MTQASVLDAPAAGIRRPGVRRGVVAAGVGVLVVLQLLYPDGDLGEAVYLAVLLGAGIVAVWGAMRRPRATRAPWCWIAAGVCLSGLGDLTYSIYFHLRGIEPDISAADIPWLASYLAIVIGLLMLLRRNRREDRSDVDGLIDMAVVAVVALLVVWQVSVQATVTDTSVAPGVRAIWASYPILDAALLALVVRTATSRTAGALPLAGGVVCWLFSDFVYLLFPSSSSAWAAWLSAGWMIGAALLATATWSSERAPASTRSKEHIGSARVALAVVPLLVAPLIEVVSYQLGVTPNPLPLLIASCVLAALAYARAVRLMRTSEAAHAELEDAARHFGALVKRSSDAALIVERDGHIKYVSPAAEDQFGYTAEALVGEDGWELIHPDDLAGVIEALSVIGDVPGGHTSAELRIRDASGNYRWVEEVVTNLLDEPAVGGLVANIRDISNRKAAEQQLSRLAHYDDLTGLPNRRLLAQELADSLDEDASRTALLVIDLDHFKFVNDSRSHAVGDLLIGAVAKRLGTILAPTDTLARTGGDEFAVLCRDVSTADALRRAEDVERSIAEPFDLHASGTYAITASVGIAVAEDGVAAQQLLQRADTAMYAAKARGAGETVVYDATLRRKAEDWISIQTDLRSALRNHELVVHYQPVIDLTTGAMDGVEALVRWRHPTRGLLLPGEFVPVAEASDLIDGIGEFVLGQACSDAAWWARAGSPMSVAVNISAAQLGQGRVVHTIQAALYESGLEPEQLIIEITETALLSGSDRVMETVNAIRALRVRIALDDFGTGHSSLSYLKSVPAEIVKIDRSFVTDIVDNQTDRDIAAAIIDLASALGRTVIAEGIETEEQRTVLRRLGCPLAQGFLWSPAVPAEAVLVARARYAAAPQTLRALPR